MIRLFVDCHVFDDGFGGTRTYLEGIYQKMVVHEDIEFYFAARNVDTLRKAFGDGQNVHYIQLSNVGKFKRLAVEIPALIKQYKIDYAHYQYISPLYKCCKEIVTVHDLLFLDMPQYFPWSYRIKNAFLFGRSAKRADILLTVSEFSRGEITKFFGIPKEKISITHNGILLPPDNIDKPDVKYKFCLDKYILTVSRIEPRKNHLALLKAYVELKLWTMDYKLVFVGRYDWSNKDFDEYYNNLSDDVKKNIVIKGANYAELIQLYQNASLFVFPSFAEGFGIPPIESLAFNCPLLCSNATAMAEFKLPAEWTFDPHDVQDLKIKMTKILNDRPDLREERNRILAVFNWEKISNDLYYKIKYHSTL